MLHVLFYIKGETEKFNTTNYVEITEYVYLL